MLLSQHIRKYLRLTKRIIPKVKEHLLKALEPVDQSKFYFSMLYNAQSQKCQSQNEQVSTYAAEVEKIVLGAHPLTGIDDATVLDAREKERLYPNECFYWRSYRFYKG